MIKKILFFLFLCIAISAQAQTSSKEFRQKTFLVKSDTLKIDTVAINPQEFKIKDVSFKIVPATEYEIDFSNAVLIINSKKYTSISVEYFTYPDFITKTYTPFNEKIIINDAVNTAKAYRLTSNVKKTETTLFEGLQTKGFISRGITSGNNQNAVTNAALDLEISGKLSKKVTLKANIWDTNIPIQENGYSQNITDFDRIFIEMFTDNWRVKAGDISLQNQDSYFMPINKQISGLRVEASIHKKLKVAASGAIIRGKFNSYTFTGIEGNQGPYKIYGLKNEAAILMIEGSEQVFINGILIEQGAEKDYTIDYNLAEITFNTTFPITNDLRIAVEFQYADRNYNRFVTYQEANYSSENLNISAYFYNENDAKNQPIQNNLTDTQKQILENAGNNSDLMVAESAYLSNYDENKILYKKNIVGSISIFEHSTNASDELYFVTFTNVGANNGDYQLEKNTAIGNIYKFVGINLGDYSPIIGLNAPTKTQTYVLKADYKTSKKGTINTEIALSNNDANLFSTKDDENNVALATKLGWSQVLIDKKWQLKSTISHEFVQQNFNTEQGWETVEFNRDWNILDNNETKSLFQTEIALQNKKDDFVLYRYNDLRYKDIFTGIKHEILSKIAANKTSFYLDVSFLKNTSSLEKNSFYKVKTKIEHNFNKKWLGTFINVENNSRKNNVSKEYINTSHQFKEFETYFGVGDTTNVFAKFGFNYRNNDSIKNNTFTEINNRKTLYLNSNLIKKKNTNLSLFANYRITENSFSTDEKSLNSKLTFSQKLFDNFIHLNTVYETSSGNIARQEYIYVKTEPGLGFYTWIDYNNDGVKDFDEFEIAEFTDQASYLRLPKPNLQFTPTQRAKFTQSIIINPTLWSTKKGLQKVLSKLYNQTFLNVENQQERIGDSFNFNPFNFDKNKLLSLQLNIRNSLYFNKNLQRYSTTYTFGKNTQKQQYFIGSQENNLLLHQLEFNHKFADFWLFEVLGKSAKNNLNTENFTNRNYKINSIELAPKISFLYNQDNRLTAFYHYKNKKNELDSFEELKQQKIGLEYFYISSKKNQVSANINLFLNNFKGDTNTPVAYQMLEGLQNGKNYTWNVLFNQKINALLNLNLSYLGRKSVLSKTIHTGSIQLKAIF